MIYLSIGLVAQEWTLLGVNKLLLFIMCDKYNLEILHISEKKHICFEAKVASYLSPDRIDTFVPARG